MQSDAKGLLAASDDRTYAGTGGTADYCTAVATNSATNDGTCRAADGCAGYGALRRGVHAVREMAPIMTSAAGASFFMV